MVGPDSHRRILHVDMDAFYAAVEQRDRPDLRGKPIIVGGPPQSRGVVCTASYEARVFGIHSAMPSARAYRLCPHGIFLAPDFPRYAEVSRQVREIFFRYTDLVEPVSLDEAYLDVTENALGLLSGTRVAEAIRRDIATETGLTASAGVAPCKLVAKIASDMNKPDGLTVVPPDRVLSFLEDLPVRKIPGIGKVSEKRCHEKGIRTCGDFRRYDEAQLGNWFGSAGAAYYRLCRGVDSRPVIVDQTRRSCSIEDTFAVDITRVPEALSHLRRLADGLASRLRRGSFKGRTVTLKVKYSDFTLVTRSRTLEDAVDGAADLESIAIDLLPLTEIGRRPVRLLGLGVSHLEEPGAYQQLLLPWADDPVNVDQGPSPR